MTWSLHFAGHPVLQGPESLGHVQCQNQKEKLSMSTSRAPDAAWKGCCLPGNLPLSSLSILSSSDTCIPVGPLISRPCNQQQLPQLQKGEMIFQLSNGPGSSVSCWMATGAPLGLPQPLGTDDQAHTGLSTRYPGLSPWDRLHGTVATGPPGGDKNSDG